MQNRPILFALFVLGLILLFAIVLGMYPAEAQGVTETPPVVVPDVVIVPDDVTEDTPVIVIPPDAMSDKNEIVLTAILAAVGVAVAFGLPVLLALFFMAWNHLPSWAQSLVLANRPWIEARVDEGTNALVNAAKLTPGTFDDELAAYIDRTVDSKVRERLGSLSVSRTAPENNLG